MKASLLCILLWLCATSSFASELSALWEVNGFKMPESVVYDADHQRFYVSNINDNPLGQDGNGSIGWISADGYQSETEWVTGLHSPKGMLLHQGYLYVCDVKQLVVINVAQGTVTARYEAPSSVVLNGIAISRFGEIYVSDWLGNSIYTLNQRELTLWLHSDALEHPNGLYVRHGHLYVGAWGNGIQADFSTEESGSLKRISLRSKQIQTLSHDEQWMNLDGLHPLPRGQWLATDFVSGQLLRLNHQGNIVEQQTLEVTAADFYYNHKQKLLVVPFIGSNKVVAYRLD